MSEDVYKRGAMLVLGLPEHEVTHDQRQRFKEVFFATYRDRIYAAGEHMSLRQAEDGIHKAKGLMERVLQRMWPIGTLVNVQVINKHTTTAAVTGYDGMDVRVRCCKVGKKGKQHTIYVHWERLTKWPKNTDNL